MNGSHIYVLPCWHIRAGTYVHGKLYIYAWTYTSCCACLCMEGGSAAAGGTLPWGSPCALDMTAAICLLSSSLSWLRSASMPAGITVCKELPAPPAPPPAAAAAAAASPSGSPSPSKLASLPMAQGDSRPPRSRLALRPPSGSPRPEEPPEPGSAVGACRRRGSQGSGPGPAARNARRVLVPLAGDARSRCLLHVGQLPEAASAPRAGRGRSEQGQPGAVRPSHRAPPPRPRPRSAHAPLGTGDGRARAHPVLRRSVSFHALGTDLKEPGESAAQNRCRTAGVSFRHISGGLNLSCSGLQSRGGEGLEGRCPFPSLTHGICSFKKKNFFFKGAFLKISEMDSGSSG